MCVSSPTYSYFADLLCPCVILFSTLKFTCVCMCVCALVCHVQLFAIPWIVAHQEFSRQEH